MSQNKILFLAAVVLLGISLYVSYLQETGLESAPVRKRERVSLCPKDQEYFSLERALRNPENVCLLQATGLTRLPPEIKKFKNLKQLNLRSTNHIAAFPSEVGAG